MATEIVSASMVSVRCNKCGVDTEPMSRSKAKRGSAFRCDDGELHVVSFGNDEHFCTDCILGGNVDLGALHAQIMEHAFHQVMHGMVDTLASNIATSVGKAEQDEGEIIEGEIVEEDDMVKEATPASEPPPPDAVEVDETFAPIDVFAHGDRVCVTGDVGPVRDMWEGFISCLGLTPVRKVNHADVLVVGDTKHHGVTMKQEHAHHKGLPIVDVNEAWPALGRYARNRGVEIEELCKEYDIPIALLGPTIEAPKVNRIGLREEIRLALAEGGDDVFNC